MRSPPSPLEVTVRVGWNCWAFPGVVVEPERHAPGPAAVSRAREEDVVAALLNSIGVHDVECAAPTDSKMVRGGLRAHADTADILAEADVRTDRAYVGAPRVASVGGAIDQDGVRAVDRPNAAAAGTRSAECSHDWLLRGRVAEQVRACGAVDRRGASNDAQRRARPGARFLGEGRARVGRRAPQRADESP